MSYTSFNLKVDETLCTGCGRCVELCPTDNLIMNIRGLPVVQYDECWYCSVCEVECPTDAIDLQLPFLIR